MDKKNKEGCVVCGKKSSRKTNFKYGLCPEHYVYIRGNNNQKVIFARVVKQIEDARINQKQEDLNIILNVINKYSDNYAGDLNKRNINDLKLEMQVKLGRTK